MNGRTSMNAGGGEAAVAALPAAAAVPARASSARATLLKAWVPALLALVLLDVTFNLWFWRIPKLTPAWADYGYQFLVDARDTATTAKTPGVPRVIAIGSSVAGAFDPAQVQTLLRAQGVPAEVRRLLLPGIKPSDLRLFFATDGADLAPDVVVILLNPLDFLNPSFERDLKPQVRGVLPPWPTLRERGAFVSTVAGKLDLAAASVSNLYRYRKPLRSALEDHLRLVWRWRRGAATQGFGWDADGYTHQHFAVPLAAGADGFEYYIDPIWIAQRGAVTLTFSTAAGELARRTETTPGWKRVELSTRDGQGGLLYVSADSVWSPRAAQQDLDTRLLGVRLREVPALAAGRDRVPPHYPPLERETPDTLLRMQGATGDEFVARWQALLEADTEFGRRFRAYRDSKLAERNATLTATGEYAELEHLVQDFTARGAAVMLINNPESELLRAQYTNEAYYQSYLAYLTALAARHPGTEFHDFGPVLPIDEFNDWHHVSYIGAIRLGPSYAALLQTLLTKPPACL